MIHAAESLCSLPDKFFLLIAQIGSRQVIIELAAGFDFHEDQRFAIEQHNIQFAGTIVCRTVPPVASEDRCVAFAIKFNGKVFAPAAYFKAP